MTSAGDLKPQNADRGGGTCCGREEAVTEQIMPCRPSANAPDPLEGMEPLLDDADSGYMRHWDRVDAGETARTGSLNLSCQTDHSLDYVLRSVGYSFTAEFTDTVGVRWRISPTACSNTATRPASGSRRRATKCAEPLSRSARRGSSATFLVRLGLGARHAAAVM